MWQSTPLTRPFTKGIADHVGSLEEGKLADICLWKPALFGVKPEIVIKGGAIAWAQMGDPNASIPTPQPIHMRPMFGSYGGAIAATSLTLCLPGGDGGGYFRTNRHHDPPPVPVANCPQPQQKPI